MLELLLILILIGFLIWAVITYIPMPQPFRGIIIVVGVIIAILLVARAFGIGDGPGGLSTLG